jgi:hypothetical protein
MNLPRLRHVWTTITGYRRSFALLSAANGSEVDRAIVFVHGFNGKATSTWTDFLSLVDDDKIADHWWQNADLYFFDYHWRSVFRRIGENSDRLLGFLDYLFPQPPRELFETAEMSLRPEFKYKALVLVGHSEGGLLLRKIILEAARRDDRLEKYVRDVRDKGLGVSEPVPDGLLVAQLRLFAPAIGGASLSGFLGAICSLPLVGSALHVSAAKEGLSNSAEPVRGAREYTNKWAEALTMECFRAHIVWAEHDAIVEPESYQFDVACTKRPPGTKHSSVCKPTRKYLLPLQFVEKGVKNGGC